MSSREYSLKRLYGITLQQYASLLKKQMGRCAICLRPATYFKTNLCVDHDHKTGEIFGLLCHFCNRRFIGRNRNPDMYKTAHEYLSKGTGWIVPPRKKKKRKKR